MIPRRLHPGMSALRAFDAVARLGSFTAAARELNLTQGAVSRQVAALEAQLGASLVARDGRRAGLTPAGTAYAPRVRAALEILGQGAMEALGQAPETGLRLAILPTFGTRWLMPRIPGFVRRHPEVTLSFLTRIGRFDLAAEGVDAAIHSGRADWPGARLTLLMSERVMPVAAPGVARIEGQALLALASRPGAWPEWWAATGRAGPVPAALMRFEQVATLAQAAAAGMGVALLPAFLIRPELASGALVPLGDEVPSGAGYYLVAPEPGPRGREKPTVARFRDWLLTEVARDTVV
jgi:LysR family transcriptional regulator, glycine cleavage system transcriptional activator